MGKIEVLGEELVSVTLYPPSRHCDGTWAFDFRSKRLDAWSMERHESVVHFAPCNTAEIRTNSLLRKTYQYSHPRLSSLKEGIILYFIVNSQQYNTNTNTNQVTAHSTSGKIFTTLPYKRYPRERGRGRKPVVVELMLALTSTVSQLAIYFLANFPSFRNEKNAYKTTRLSVCVPN
jgi:hypothetical protein